MTIITVHENSQFCETNYEDVKGIPIGLTGTVEYIQYSEETDDYQENV